MKKKVRSSSDTRTTIDRSHQQCGVLPIPGPFIAILFRTVRSFAFRRLLPGILFQRDVLETPVARVPVRELAGHFVGRRQGSVLVILAGQRMILPRGLLVTVAGGCVPGAPVGIHEAAIVLATAVPNL